MTLSIAYSKSLLPTLDFFVLAACKADSFIKLAKSAPLNPGVRVAKRSGYVSGFLSSLTPNLAKKNHRMHYLKLVPSP